MQIWGAVSAAYLHLIVTTLLGLHDKHTREVYYPLECFSQYALLVAYNNNFTVVFRYQNRIYPKMMQSLSYLTNSFKTKNNLGFHKNSVHECCSPEKGLLIIIQLNNMFC